MKTNCKRLLSLVVALVMVLVMIPVFQIQAGAVDLNSVNWEDVNANFNPATETTCPFCAGTVTWTELTSGAKPTAGAAHYYVPAGTTADTDFSSIGGSGEGVSMCLYLTPGTVLKARVVARPGCTTNIFGNGAMKSRSTGADNPVVFANSGNTIVNIYGGELNGRTTSDNGGTIEMHKDSKTANGNNTLNIGGTAEIKGGAAVDGGNIYGKYTDVTISGSAEITGGEATRGGNILVNYGTYTQTNGVVKNGTATGKDKLCGGNIIVLNSTVEGEGTGLTISGGQITGGKATDTTNGCGGNIVISKTDALISGGRIGRGYAAANGGAINLGDATSSLTISGGKIFGGVRLEEGVADGPAQNAVNGGLIYSNGGNVTISGGQLGLTQNDVTAGDFHGMVAEKGGSIYMAGGTLAISGGQIYGGESTGSNSKGHGGNVYAIGAEILMTGGTVEAGVAPRGGNFLLFRGSSLNVAGASAENIATIRDGESKTHGGNIYAYGFSGQAGNAVTVGANTMISGGKAITNAAGHGGNITVDSPADATSVSTLTINGGTITGGQANADGGNVYATGTTTTATMTGGLVENGTGEKTDVADDPETPDDETAVVYKPNNMAVFSGAVMHFQGGTLNNGGFKVDSANSKLYLSGNATVNPEDSRLAATTGANVYILQGWSGAVRLYTDEQEDITFGTQLTTVKAGELSGTGEFVAGDVAYTGTLSYQGLSASVVLDDRTDAVGDMAVGNIKFLNLSDGTDAKWATSLNSYDITKHYIRLSSQTGEFELTKDVIMDVGNKPNLPTLTSTEEVTLSLIDTNNDGFDAAKCSPVKITGNVTLDRDVTADGKRYIAIDNEDGTVSAHRVSMEVTNVLLSTEQNGYAFQAKFEADATVKANMEYGIVASKIDMPGTDFVVENSAAGQKVNDWTVSTELPEDGVVNGHGIGKILVEGSTKTSVATKVYTNLYMTITVSEDADPLTIVSDEENVGEQAGIGVSLLDILKVIDQNWTEYEAAQQKVNAFVAPYAEIFAGEFTNINAE